jgi:hypothetical protein
MQFRRSKEICNFGGQDPEDILLHEDTYVRTVRPDQCVIVWGASSGVIMVCVYSSNT